MYQQRFRGFKQNRQRCLAQKCGNEHSIHKLRDNFYRTENEGALWNSNGAPINLYVNGGTILCQEETTRRSPGNVHVWVSTVTPHRPGSKLKNGTHDANAETSTRFEVYTGSRKLADSRWNTTSPNDRYQQKIFAHKMYGKCSET